jgi:hypothetical protein
MVYVRAASIQREWRVAFLLKFTHTISSTAHPHMSILLLTTTAHPHMSIHTGINENLGNLIEVEEAIAKYDDLNGYVETTKGDSYTLLLLACFNDHLDAVQRLLTYGGVEINRGSQVSD